MLEVGRSSVREAMKTLEAMGFVKRTTVGTIVSDQEVAGEKLRIDARHTEIHEVIETRRLIEIQLAGQGRKYIFYKDSVLLTQLFYYPYIQFVVIGLFLLIAYFLFSTARKSEQNQVWVGISKETAHQLGTPVSSMMA